MLHGALVLCLVTTAAQQPSVSLTLIPPSPVTDKITLDVRGAVANQSATPRQFEVSFYLDREESKNLLHRESLDVPAESARSVFFRWPTSGSAGRHRVLLVARSESEALRIQRPLQIVASAVPSTRRIGGAWISFNLPEMFEGLLYDSDLAKMTDLQWRELVRAMHEVGMDVVVVLEAVHNHQHVGQHRIEQDGYSGKAFYPSKLHPRRMPMAAEDPIEAVLSEADRHGMYVFVGCGNYAWFDYSPASLKWHKALADELWERYGHHDSFYGWYLTEEGPGDLGKTAQRKQWIVDFFRQFQAHVRAKAPAKPVMVAFNTYRIPEALDTYPKLLPYVDILAPFCFDRMESDKLTGKEAEKLLRGLCKQAGTHLWIDMELFTFGARSELHPPSIRKVDRILQTYPDFEKVICFQYPGLMNAPWASIKPGGQPTVKLFRDYQTYLKHGLDACRIKHTANDRPVRLVHPYSLQYTGEEAAIDANRRRDTGGGDGALTDGWLGGHNLRDGWQGFQGADLDATIDLGKPTRITSIDSRFFQQISGGIFLPTSVQYGVSDDGRQFKVAATVRHNVSPRLPGPLTHTLCSGKLEVTARYVRVWASSVGKIPEWHPAKGKKAWLFADEIMVNSAAEQR